MTTTEHKGRPQYEIPAGIKVDWNNTNGAIAEQLQVSPLTVMRLRKRLGKKALKPGRPFQNAVLPTSTLKEAKAQFKQLQRTISALSEIFEANKKAA
jgi:hypothetical protein